MGLIAALDILQSFVALPSGGHSTHPSGSFFSPHVIIIHVILLGLIAFEFFTVVSFWLGRAWGRWLVLAGCFFYLTGLRDLRSQWHNSHFTAELTVFAAVLAIYLLWYLHTEHVKEWFARNAPEISTVGVPTEQ
jgi:hypothetical protein